MASPQSENIEARGQQKRLFPSYRNNWQIL